MGGLRFSVCSYLGMTETPGQGPSGKKSRRLLPQRAAGDDLQPKDPPFPRDMGAPCTAHDSELGPRVGAVAGDSRHGVDGVPGRTHARKAGGSHGRKCIRHYRGAR
jgi:hypothetical protein